MRIMKNLSFIFLLFCSVQVFAQTKGITYQAVIYNPTGESLPGVNNANAPMANKNVCLQFSIVDASSQIEYQELISTTTDEFGMVNLVIGNGTQTSGYATSFSTIAWSVDQKSMKVALDIQGQCTDFVDISNQKFEAVPYAFSANTADNISGILPIENGGTNASTVLGAKTNLGLENVDNTSDLNKPISTATQAALDLKEDQVNKSTATTLGTSDVLYPTQNAVKTYVDASTTNINAAIANEAAIRAAADNVLTTNLATEVTNRINGDNTLTTNLATEVSNRINADNVLTTNLATEVLNRTNADVILTNNLAAEVTNRTNADLLKEDLVNKSTATTLGTSDILYPTQNAVKTYVDATSTSNTTALNNEAAIRAAADVVLTNDLATEVTNRTNADLLKENTANKSTATTLGTSNVLFPTQNAVKTYVDASATTNAAAVTNEAAIRAAADVVLTNNLATEVTNRTNADLLKENLANKSTNTALGTSDVFYPTQNAVKSYVDAGVVNATNALNNEAAIRAAADATLTTNLATEVTNRSIEDNNLATSIATEVTNRTNADLLKENLTNKSTDVVVDGNSNTKYPTVKSIKDYVDAAATTNSGAISNEAAIRAAADLVLTNNLATEVTNRTNADLLKEDLVNKSNNLVFDGTSTIKYPTVKTVKDYVDLNAATAATNLSNEAAARSAADNTLTTNLNIEALSRINGDLLKENTANKSTTTTLGNSDVLFPTQNAVKTYVDANTTSNSTAINNEAAIRAAADVVLTNDLAAEVAARTAADVLLTNDIAAEAAARTAADLLKENTANKSTATTLGNSDVLFPTQNAVKTYVDATSTSNTTALNNEAVIRAAADVVLTNDLATEVTNRTNADLLKENTANKSTSTSLGTSNVLFPTQNAVKTYVDASTAAGTTGLNNEAAIRAAADVVLTNDIAAEAAARTAADLLKENTANKSTATALGTSNVLFPTQNAVKTYVDAVVSNISTVDATTTVKGKIQLAGDLDGTAAAPVVAANAITTSKILDANVTDAKIATVSGSKVTGNITGSAANVTGTVAVANGGTGAITAAGALTNLGAAPIASPTFTGTVTSPIYASTPQALTDGTTISWNPTNGLNASVTLGGNRTLSFASTPAVGSYGTLIVTQDATGNRTITLPSTSNKVLGSASTTTIALSTAPNAKDILNFYYDGTNCYWNIGQGYGTAAAAVITNLATGVSGTLPVANGGSGATTLTGIIKGNGTSAMTAAVAGTDYVIPSGSITGNAANVTGTVAIANGGTGQTTIAGVKGILGLTTTNVAIGASSGTTNQGTGAVGIGNGTGQTNQGSQSVAIGYVAGNSNQGANSVAIGSNAAQGGQGTQSVAIGIAANSGANNATAVGGFSSAGHTNATAIGYQAVTSGNNTIQLGADGVSIAGSTAITNVKTSGTLTAGTVTYPNTHGSSGQVLSTTGSGTLTWVAPSATSLTGTVAVANGGTGTTSLTGYVKGNGTSAMTASTSIPLADVTGAAPIASPTFTGTPSAPTAAANTNTTQVATTAFVSNALATAGLPSQSGNNGKYLTTNGSAASWAASPGVPYSGATGAVNLGNYNLTVYGVKVGVGSGPDPYFLQYSTVVGKDALVSNTYGWQNNAFGFEAMNQNTTGNGNNAFGLSAMRSNTSGNNNVAVGQAALHSSVTGNMNTAIGASAAYHSLGSQVTSIGYESLMGQGTGTGNTALGWRAGAAVYGSNTFSTFLGNNATAQNGTTNATAIGNDAFVNTSNTIQLGNTSITNVKTSGTLTAGNVTYPNYHNSVNGQILTTNSSGVASWTNTIAIANGGTGATTSAAALTNLGAAPLVSPNFTGTPTAPTASTGTNNTQVASTAFVNSSISSANASLAPIWSPSFNGTPTAPTAAANTNTTQIATTAFVASALTTAGLPSQSGNNGKFLTTNGSAASWAASPGVPYSGATGAVNLGDYNLTVRGIKIGTSGTDNFALQNNMVIGKDALVNTTNGYNNMAIGNGTLGLNVGGYNNLAIGNEAQYKNLWGWGNVSLGIATLNQNVVGNFNTAVGHGAGYFLTSSYNTAIGHNALDGQANGGGNTGVGVNAGGVPWNQTTYNSTFLGYNAKAQSGLDNVIVIGYNAYTNEHNTIQLGNGSIVKLKTSGTIWSNGTQLTSDVRLKTNIQPLQNSLDVIMKLNPVHYDKKNSIESTDYNKSENGFIAQEIQKVLPFVVNEGTDKDKILSVDYNSIIPVLTKGIQEQQLQIEAQQKQIDEMKMLIEKLVKEKK